MDQLDHPLVVQLSSFGFEKDAVLAAFYQLVEEQCQGDVSKVNPNQDGPHMNRILDLLQGDAADGELDGAGKHGHDKAGKLDEASLGSESDDETIDSEGLQDDPDGEGWDDENLTDQPSPSVEILGDSTEDPDHDDGDAEDDDDDVQITGFTTGPRRLENAWLTPITTTCCYPGKHSCRPMRQPSTSKRDQPDKTRSTRSWHKLGMAAAGAASRSSAPAPWRQPPLAAERSMPLIDLVNLKVFGHASFRAQQRQVVQAALAGQDCFVLMPTGGGKSLCYQLPAIVTEGITVVVCPLLSLMQDQVRALCSNARAGVPTAYLSSQQSRAETAAVLAELSKQRPSCKLLYVTPEQLVKSARLNELLGKLYGNGRLARIVIDEAHCVSMWGHDFRPDYKALNTLKRSYPRCPIMAVTATATKRVAEDILGTLGIPRAPIFQVSFFRRNLSLKVIEKQFGTDPDTGEPLHLSLLVDYITAKGGQSGIVYCLSRDESQSVCSYLTEHDIPAGYYHAGMTPNQRMKVQNEWQQGKIQVVVATIAFGMGIDKPDVRFVVHFTFSKSLEGYFQEAGRAGRDGQESECVIMFSKKDGTRMVFMLRHGPKKVYDTGMTLLQHMMEYCQDTRACRHALLLQYFGERLPGNGRCGTCCDNCLNQGKKDQSVDEDEYGLYDEQDRAAPMNQRKQPASTARRAPPPAPPATGFVKASLLPAQPASAKQPAKSRRGSAGGKAQSSKAGAASQSKLQFPRSTAAASAANPSPHNPAASQLNAAHLPQPSHRLNQPPRNAQSKANSAQRPPAATAAAAAAIRRWETADSNAIQPQGLQNPVPSSAATHKLPLRHIQPQHGRPPHGSTSGGRNPPHQASSLHHATAFQTSSSHPGIAVTGLAISSTWPADVSGSSNGLPHAPGLVKGPNSSTGFVSAARLSKGSSNGPAGVSSRAQLLAAAGEQALKRQRIEERAERLAANRPTAAAVVSEDDSL